jgi:HEAT repeat protein
MKPRGRIAAICVGGMAILVLILAGRSLKDRAVEQWYLWKLQSKDRRTRIEAARALGEMRSIRAIPLVMELIRAMTRPAEDESWEELQQCWRVFCGVGPPAAPTATAAMRNPEAIIREEAASVVGFINERWHLKHGLVDLVTGLEDAESGVRDASAQSLYQTIEARSELEPTRSSVRRAAAGLQQALSDPEKKVRYSAAVALSQCPEVPQEKLRVLFSTLLEAARKDDWEWRCASATRALGKFGRYASDAVPVLVAILEKGIFILRRCAAAEALAEMGPLAGDALPAVMKCLGDEFAEVRVSCAWALFRLGGDREMAASTLRSALSDKKDRVRARAAGALVEMGEHDPAIDGTLLALARESGACRVDAAKSLARLGRSFPAGVSALQAMLRDPWKVPDDESAFDVFAFIAAAEGLIENEVKTEELREEIVDALETQPVLREWAAAMLGRLGDFSRAAVPALTAALRDPDEDVRIAAADALGKIEGRDAAPPR